MSRRTECSRLRERLGEWNIWITLLPGVKQVNASLRDSSVKQVNALNAPQTLNFYFTVSFLSCACLRVTFFSRTWRRYWCLENTTIQWFLELKDKNAKCLDISMSAWKLLCSSTWRGWVRPTQIVGPSFAHFSRLKFFWWRTKMTNMRSGPVSGLVARTCVALGGNMSCEVDRVVGMHW